MAESSLCDIHNDSAYSCRHYRKPAICRVPRLCRVYFIGHSAKTVFAECQIKYTRQTKTHGKIRLCRVFFSGTRQRCILPSAFVLALGKEVFCRVHKFFCDNNVVHKIYISHISHISFMKVEDTYIRFVNNVTTTTSDEQMTKINFIDLDKLWNFVVGNILIWNHLVMQKRRLNLKILKFEFFKRLRMEKLPKWKL